LEAKPVLLLLRLQKNDNAKTRTIEGTPAAMLIPALAPVESTLLPLELREESGICVGDTAAGAIVVDLTSLVSEVLITVMLAKRLVEVACLVSPELLLVGLTSMVVVVNIDEVVVEEIGEVCEVKGVEVVVEEIGEVCEVKLIEFPGNASSELLDEEAKSTTWEDVELCVGKLLHLNVPTNFEA
jgi:hypothetical protein